MGTDSGLDDFVDDYDSYRLDYPNSAVKCISEVAGVGDGSTVLEIGAGTGKATSALAALGADVYCLEPGARMADFLARRFGSNRNVSVERCRLEDWRPARRFDVMVAAQSWHLVDRELRVRRAAECLRPGGYLVLLWNGLPVASGLDASVRRAVDCGRAVAQGTGLAPSVAVLGYARATDAARFSEALTRTYLTDVVLSDDEYRSLLNTYPSFRNATAAVREDVGEQLQEAFGTNSIPMYYKTVLHLLKFRL